MYAGYLKVVPCKVRWLGNYETRDVGNHSFKRECSARRKLHALHVNYAWTMRDRLDERHAHIAELVDRWIGKGKTFSKKWRLLILSPAEPFAVFGSKTWRSCFHDHISTKRFSAILDFDKETVHVRWRPRKSLLTCSRFFKTLTRLWILVPVAT